MAIENDNLSKSLSTQKVTKGIQFFLAFTAMGIGIGLWWKTPANLKVFQSQIDWTFLIILLPLVLIDYVLGGLRFRLFFDGKILPFISLWKCMCSNWANFFMSVVTPFKTGGGPAQLYILWRNGAKISDGVLVSLFNFAATLVFYQFASLAVFLTLPENLFGSQLTNAFKLAFLLMGALAGFVLFLLLSPRLGLFTVRFLLSLWPFGLFKDRSLKHRIYHRIKRELDLFSENLSKIKAQKTGSLLITIVATVVLNINKYLMGYVVARALYQAVPFLTFIGLQIVDHFVVYFAPTPGGAGISELSSFWLMDKVMTRDALLLFTIVWRFFTIILAAFIGAAVMLIDVRTAADAPFSEPENGQIDYAPSATLKKFEG